MDGHAQQIRSSVAAASYQAAAGSMPSAHASCVLLVGHWVLRCDHIPALHSQAVITCWMQLGVASGFLSHVHLFIALSYSMCRINLVTDEGSNSRKEHGWVQGSF